MVTLLEAVEDLETVHARIYGQCEECLQSTLAAANGSRQLAAPRELLKKSISSLTASSAFSLVGSSMLDDETGTDEMRSRKDKSQCEKGGRGWDWRVGFPNGAKGRDVLAILRLGLARDVARAWIDGDGK
jgi:hypothetical protein